MTFIEKIKAEATKVWDALAEVIPSPGARLALVIAAALFALIIILKIIPGLLGLAFIMAAGWLVYRAVMAAQDKD